MANYDDLFNAPIPAAQPQQTLQPFNKEAWGQRKQQERSDAYDLIDRTAEAIATDGGAFQQYLDVQAKFDRYSAGNALLIAAQMPTATKLKDFDGWKAQHVSIKKQQKGITILEPGEEYTRADGSIGTSYNVKKLFDVSQTVSKGRAKPQPAAMRDERALLGALIANRTVAMKAQPDLPGGVGALYSRADNVILVRSGMEAADLFRSVSQELAHAVLAANSENYTRNDAAFTAYCVSYMLCKQYGFDVRGYDFSQLPANLQEADAQSVRAQLAEMRDVLGDISGKMARALESNKPPKQPEQGR